VDLASTLARSERDLLQLRDAAILISGGTGYIGRWLIEILLHANRVYSLGVRLTVISRNPAAFARDCPHLANDPMVGFVTGDTRTFCISGARFDYAIHAATDVVAINPPLETFDVTVQGTRHFLDVCCASGVKNALLISSGAVYGPLPPNLTKVPETYSGVPPLDMPRSAYGIGKLATEWLGTAYADKSGFSCASARVFAQVGPYLALDKQFAAGNFILNALRNEPIVIKGDGTPIRSYMYGTDLVTWLLAILVRGKSAQAYNVGSDVGISIRDLATAIAQVAGNPRLVIDVRGKAAPNEPHEVYVPAIARAQSELGLSLMVPLPDALHRTISWYRTRGYT
jgi:nucleoside-diphosphate-sugar epimerase